MGRSVAQIETNANELRMIEMSCGVRGPDSTTRTTYTEIWGKEEGSTELTRVGVQVSVVRRSVMDVRERPRGGAGAKVLVRAGHRRDAERSVAS